MNYYFAVSLEKLKETT